MKTRIITLVGVLAAGATGLPGCKEEPPPPPPPPPPPAPPPPEPEPVEVSALLASLDADPRLQFPQDLAPISEPLASAVIRFGDALAEGDDSALRPLLDVTAKATLERLLVTGGWYDATDALEAVRVVDLSENGDTGRVTYALQQPGEAYTMTWDVIEAPDGGLAFSAVWTPDETKSRAVEFDDGAAADTGFDRAPSDSTQSDESPLLAFYFVELNAALQRDLGVPEAPQEAVIQLMAQQSGASADEIRSGIELGRQAHDSGEQLGSTDAKQLVALFEMIVQAQGLDVGRDRIIELLADVAGLGTDELIQLLDG